MPAINIVYIFASALINTSFIRCSISHYPRKYCRNLTQSRETTAVHLHHYQITQYEYDSDLHKEL